MYNSITKHCLGPFYKESWVMFDLWVFDDTYVIMLTNVNVYNLKFFENFKTI